MSGVQCQRSTIDVHACACATEPVFVSIRSNTYVFMPRDSLYIGLPSNRIILNAKSSSEKE
jgi:hypothetical protein